MVPVLGEDAEFGVVITVHCGKIRLDLLEHGERYPGRNEGMWFHDKSLFELMGGQHVRGKSHQLVACDILVVCDYNRRGSGCGRGRTPIGVHGVTTETNNDRL